MVSWLNLISPLGMLAVGAGAMIYWYMKKHTRPLLFLYGAIFWAIAIAIKLIMDFTITTPLYSRLIAMMPIPAVVLALALYYGLRTGILESGITYLGVRFTKLSSMSFDEAVALGIGFGGAEAIILGLASFAATIVLIMQPGLLNLLSASSVEQFGALFIPLPIIERLFTLLCHVFATVLVVYTVKLNELKWLGLSMLYKTLLDGSLPIFTHYLGYLGAYEVFPVELYVVVMGLIGLYGLYWLSKRPWGGAPDAREA